MIKIEIEIAEEGNTKISLYTSTFTAVDSNMPTDAEVALATEIRKSLPELFSRIRDDAAKRYLQNVETKGEA